MKENGSLWNICSSTYKDKNKQQEIIQTLIDTLLLSKVFLGELQTRFLPLNSYFKKSL